MRVRSGRLEKRIQLAIPIQISSVLDAVATERATTENVCSKGIRIRSEHARNLNERLIVTALAGGLQARARVLYCQKLSDGLFGVGLQFERQSSEWPVMLSEAN